MYSCLLLEFYLTGALCKILTGVSCCGALLELWMPLNLNPAGSGENLQVQNKEPRYNVKVTMYSCLLLEFHLTGDLQRVLTVVPYCGALLKLWITLNLRVFTEVPYYGALLKLLSYSNLNPTGFGEIFGTPSRTLYFGKAKYNWEVA